MRSTLSGGPEYAILKDTFAGLLELLISDNDSNVQYFAQYALDSVCEREERDVSAQPLGPKTREWWQRIYAAEQGE
ncbi:MAG: hypothetical protein ABR976_17230 [Terracidiphilus sp.]|jgi:hypothetical protein